MDVFSPDGGVKVTVITQDARDFVIRREVGRRVAVKVADHVPLL